MRSRREREVAEQVIYVRGSEDVTRLHFAVTLDGWSRFVGFRGGNRTAAVGGEGTRLFRLADASQFDGAQGVGAAQTLENLRDALSRLRSWQEAAR